jgi:hypothetical protein
VEPCCLCRPEIAVNCSKPGNCRNNRHNHKFQMDPATTPSSVRGYSRVLACALCQQRKVKCDRTTPCSNCVKAGAPCTPSTPSPRRPRRRPNQDLRQRLVRCEELLLQCAVADQVQAPEPEAQSTESSQFTPSTSEAGTPGTPGKEMEPLPHRAPTGSKPAYLVLGSGDSNRVLESPIWTALYDEVRKSNPTQHRPLIP